MFSLPIRIYWEDTDAGGVVYHANYVAYLERARTEWMRSHGHGQDALRTREDLVFAVRGIAVDYLKPARLDDALEVSAVLRQVRRASMVFAQEVRRGDEVLVVAQVRIAALDAAGFRPRAIPQPLYDQLKSLETPSP
ncbi:tol-pal system-associated acyl-CoA thioesterase [Marilutibacter aestuarii]|uniref:Tol-pal system-associated acyl-CoA thioesterase n=1 Tax=Marilutibacter aestuarii TaxID=1706195 RepID=A0A508ARV6_9GAMM|nr:tol-pal system-associated acyl-CoA thioesterase [Lysobacter aestuarii]TQD51194.1 tol-pal system-associated acyl-CoA thioesterase [Lysobacter aestuarii]